ncbi:probable ATP-dependent RNA helicase DDX28 [Leptopilina boulardi]|uniref:probable ATP-dependent RNA helicase DDX28 n=1 Tax=Leptopilina boulardi TaxID=63433 RepID=UPI0021F5AB87|nr:probable ATP-dependent RNA helicase DDX28 [Leptopilina boulardi]
MLSRIYGICQRNVNSCVVSSKFCTYFEEPTYIKFDKNVENSEFDKPKKKIPIITCKRSKYNYYQGQNYPKFAPLPLASDGWHIRKSKGDYFTINPINEDIQESNENRETITFKDLGVSDKLVENLRKQFEIKTPTTIQRDGIPVILEQQNVKLLAETGCGKTFAYLLPLIDQIFNWKEKIERNFNHPLALIITPSRELSIQIGKVAMLLTKDLNIRTKVVIGGGIKSKISNPPASNVDIIIGTIGAISKHTTIGIYKMKYVRHVVLDEADSLFDETFYEKVRYFLQKITFGPLKEFSEGFPKYSQLTLVSATMPQFIDDFLENIVDLSSLEEIATDKVHRVNVLQKFLRLGVQQKPMTLLRLIKSKAKNKIPVIVFCNSGKTCDWVCQFLNEFEVRSIRLNGDMPLYKRKNKFREFYIGVYNVLCTTDAGARGLDTIMVKDVINFDFPLQTSEYIHRCGRTARVGSPKDCRVINFVSRTLEIQLTQKIERAVKLNKPLPMCDYLKKNWTLSKEDERQYRLDEKRDKQNIKENFQYFPDNSPKDLIENTFEIDDKEDFVKNERH